MNESRSRGARRAAQMIIAAVVVLSIAAFFLSALSIKVANSPSGGAVNQPEHRPVSCWNVESLELVNCDAALAEVSMSKSAGTVSNPAINKHQEE